MSEQVGINSESDSAIEGKSDGFKWRDVGISFSLTHIQQQQQHNLFLSTPSFFFIASSSS
jgi:hypothetical protein